DVIYRKLPPREPAKPLGDGLIIRGKQHEQGDAQGSAQNGTIACHWPCERTGPARPRRCWRGGLGRLGENKCRAGRRSGLRDLGDRGGGGGLMRRRRRRRVHEIERVARRRGGLGGDWTPGRRRLWARPFGRRRGSAWTLR